MGTQKVPKSPKLEASGQSPFTSFLVRRECAYLTIGDLNHVLPISINLSARNLVLLGLLLNQEPTLEGVFSRILSGDDTDHQWNLEGK